MSTLRVDNIENSSGSSSPITIPGTAKAWVNFDGTGTVAIRASYNVSSITDGGVGIYTVNFTIPMADANYSAVINSGSLNTGSVTRNSDIQTISTADLSYNVYTGSSSSAFVDPSISSVAVFR